MVTAQDNFDDAVSRTQAIVKHSSNAEGYENASFLMHNDDDSVYVVNQDPNA